jgi:hypothetical protein
VAEGCEPRTLVAGLDFSSPGPVVGACGTLLLALDGNGFGGCVVVLKGFVDSVGVGGMKLIVGPFVEFAVESAVVAAGAWIWGLSAGSPLLSLEAVEAISVAGGAVIAGGKENAGFVEGPLSVFAGAKG